MPRRLSERFRPGDQVEIHLLTQAGEQWLPGTVIAEQSPGLWVRTGAGQNWYVTNGSRIRPLPDVQDRS